MDDLDERIANAYRLLEYYKQAEIREKDEGKKVESQIMCNKIRTLIKEMIEFEDALK